MIVYLVLNCILRKGVFFMKKLLSFGPIFIVIAAVLWALDGVLRISLYSLPPAVIVFYEQFQNIIASIPIATSISGDILPFSCKTPIAFWTFSQEVFWVRIAPAAISKASEELSFLVLPG